MITDKIENAELYFNLHPDFKLAFEELRKGNFKSGKNIINDNLYVNYEEYKTFNISERRFEAHKKYIDIQFVVNGVERMGYSNIDDADVVEEYSSEKDVMFLRAENPSFINVREGFFVIFYPQDAHMPCLLVDEPKDVKKFVAKVKI